MKFFLTAVLTAGLFHISVSQAFVKSFDTGKFEKCMTQCDKALDKDRKNLDAWVYKAAAQLEWYIADPKTRKSYFNKSVKTLESAAQKINRSDVAQHSAAQRMIKTIFRIAGQSPHGETPEFLDKTLWNLYEAFQLPEAAYQVFRLRQLMGIQDAGLLNECCKLLYQTAKEQKPLFDNADQAFVDLFNIILENADVASAFQVWERGTFIFPDSKALQASLIDAFAHIYRAGRSSDSTAVWDNMKLAFGKFPADTTLEINTWNILHYYFDDDPEKADRVFTGYFLMKPFEQWKYGPKERFTEMVTYTGGYGHSNTDKTLYEVPAALGKILAEKHKLTFPAFLKQQFRDAWSSNQLYCRRLFYMIQVYGSKKDILDEEKWVIRKVAESPDITFELLDAWQYILPGKIIPHKNMKINMLAEIRDHIKGQDWSLAASRVRQARQLFPNDKEVAEVQKELVIADYKANYNGSSISCNMIGWTGSVESCKAGTVSIDAYDKMLQRLKYFRRTAGVCDDVVWLDSLHHYYMAAALIMKANESLTHSPGPEWKCYSKEGYRGASTSNLSWGSCGSASITGQMFDSGGGNQAAGHRRWILNPTTHYFAAGSTDATMSLYAFGQAKSPETRDSIIAIHKKQAVCWPAEGYFPESLISYRWSFALYGAELEGAKVSVMTNGKPVTIKVNDLEHGYGMNTLVFEMPTNSYKTGDVVTVKISHLVSSSSKEKFTYTYTVHILAVE